MVFKIGKFEKATCMWMLATTSADENFYKVQMVRFNEPVPQGIRSGRINKLYVTEGAKSIVIHYDRGWRIRPETKGAKALLRALVEKYN